MFLSVLRSDLSSTSTNPPSVAGIIYTEFFFKDFKHASMFRFCELGFPPYVNDFWHFLFFYKIHFFLFLSILKSKVNSTFTSFPKPCGFKYTDIFYHAIQIFTFSYPYWNQIECQLSGVLQNLAAPNTQKLFLQIQISAFFFFILK